MDLSQYNKRKDKEVLAYVVRSENILGYLFKTGMFFYIGILRASVLRGAIGFDNLSGPISVLGGENKTVRKATQADFDAFFVHSEGYDLNL